MYEYTSFCEKNGHKRRCAGAGYRTLMLLKKRTAHAQSNEIPNSGELKYAPKLSVSRLFCDHLFGEIFSCSYILHVQCNTIRYDKIRINVFICFHDTHATYVYTNTYIRNTLKEVWSRKTFWRKYVVVNKLLLLTAYLLCKIKFRILFQWIYILKQFYIDFFIVNGRTLLS